MSIVDITFVGAGPTALFGVFCAGMRQATSRVVDSLDALGGQLTALYPEKHIFDVGGLPSILAKDLVGNLEAQMAPFHPDIRLNETVQDLRLGEDGTYTLVTDKGKHRSRAVVLTVGIGSFTPRKVEVEGLEPFESRWVHYFVKDKAAFQDRKVVIIGGGDSAFDWVTNLKDVASHITLVHRSDKFRALDQTVHEVQELVGAGKVALYTYYVLQSVDGDESGLRSVTIAHTKNGETVQVPADQLIPMLGFKANLGPLKEWKVPVDGHERGLDFDGDLIKVDTTMRTGLPNVYAAGDATSYEGKLKLIALGFGEVAIAVASAVGDIRGKKVGTLHSSNLASPAELAKKLVAP